MASIAKPFSREFYREQLLGAGIEIIMRADDMLGAIDGVLCVKVSFEINPQEIVAIDVQKTYISERTQFKTKNKEGY